MTEATALALQDAADEIGGIDCETRDDYSGRGMFGSRTYAVTVSDMNDICVLAACAARSMTQADQGRECEEFIDSLRKLRTDNMGRDSIVVY